MRIFLDTSALIAYYNVDDKYHADAVEMMQKLKKGEVPLTRFYVTDYVFDETVTFIECVLNKHELAVSVGEALQTSPFTIVIRIDENLFEESWSFFKTNKQYSFTDCTSFNVMRRLSITNAFTFDKHFKSFGFQTIP